MKKIIFLFIISLLLVACGSYKTVDLGKLTTGMSKAEVEYRIGPPERVLAVNDKREGFQEVLQYRTNRDEIYALEFWNDYLVGYEFLYDDVTYIPALAPPVVYPPRGRPIYIINDSRPGRPNPPARPQPSPNEPRPGTPRPGSSGSNSSGSRPSTRPESGNSRPSTRPGTSTGSGTTGSTRPTTRPANDKSSSTSRPSTNTESGRSSSGSGSSSSSSGRSR